MVPDGILSSRRMFAFRSVTPTPCLAASVPPLRVGRGHIRTGRPHRGQARRYLQEPVRWNDPRLQLGDEFILVKSDSDSRPLKLGYFNPHGWLGYSYDDVFFVKRFGVRRDKEYADYGSNSEIYTNHRATELESLGPLVDLHPHEDIVHTETWEVYKDTEIPKELFGGKTLQEVLNKPPDQNQGTEA